jgi:hypothetical protein
MLENQKYEIWIGAQLGKSCADWFEGLNIRHEANGETVLSGAFDQAALRGTLMQIFDLGLPLILVQRVEEQS